MPDAAHTDPSEPSRKAIEPLLAEADLPEPYSFEELRDLQESAQLAKADTQRLQSTPPFELGQFLSRLEVDERRELLRQIPIEFAGQVVAEMEPDAAAALLEAMRETRAIQLLEELDPDDSADIFGEMEAGDRERLLKKIDPEAARTLRRLIAYAPDTAGGIMNPQVATVYPEMTVTQTVRLIQRLSDKFEHIHYIYVTDHDDQLQGVISMRDLVFARGSDKIADIMQVDLKGVIPVEMDQEAVAQMMAGLNLNSLPVVNAQGQLQGVITHDDIMDVIRDEATEDIQIMVGAGGDETINDSITRSVKRRFPWLVVNLFTAGIAGIVIALFEEQIAQATILAICMPIVANLGGNTGAQTLAIVIRSLATGDLQTGDGKKVLTKEGLKGLFNGVLVGLVGATLAILYKGDFNVGVVVFFAMMLSMAYAGAAGAVIPFVLQKMGQDPAQSSSIFVTATTDIFGFAVFLSLGSWLLL
jgi:magnesium transporter